jgi:hypothetical protein
LIPRRFVRTIPADPPPEAEIFWEGFQRLHPDWEFVTWQDPIDPGPFPVTSRLWSHCASGAQRAGLIRLEDLAARGGHYVDADVECYRSFEPLTGLRGYAGWEDEKVVPDAVLGAEVGHPAIVECLSRALSVVAGGGGAWESGPGVTTTVLPGRDDWLLLSPGSFYSVHYREKHLLAAATPARYPWALALHWYAGSWLTPAQKAQLARPRATPRNRRG